MRPHRIVYTVFISIFISLLVIGLGVLGYFMFSPNKPNDEGLKLRGKVYVYENINVAWADDITQTEKTELLNGATETEYFEGVKSFMSMTTTGYSIEFTSEQNLTIITSEGEKNYTYVIDGNTVTITDSEGVSQDCTYENSKLIIRISEEGFISMMRVKINIILKED